MELYPDSGGKIPKHPFTEKGPIVRITVYYKKTYHRNPC
jgi:hypothetical protein